MTTEEKFNKFQEYTNSTKFSSGQLDEIELGIVSGVDVDIYANAEYPDLTMRILRLGLELGFNVREIHDNSMKNYGFHYKIVSIIQSRILSREDKIQKLNLLILEH